METERTYRLIKTSRAKMVITLLVCFTVMIIAAVKLNTLINKNDYSAVMGYIFGSLVPAVLLFVCLKRLYSQKINAVLTGNHLLLQTASGKNIFDNPLSDVHTMMKMIQGEAIVIKLWDRTGREFLSVLLNFITSGKKDRAEALQFFSDLLQATHAVKGATRPELSFKGHAGDYYHSTLEGSTREFTATAFHQKQQATMSKKIAVAIAGMFLFFVVCGLLKGLSNGNYTIDGKVVSYNDKVVPGCNGIAFKPLSYLTGKDSLHVFYKGIVQPDLDAVTFRSLGRSFFIDKNGLYREPSWGWFSKSLTPVNGIDKGSFRQVGNVFADKDKVYVIDVFASDPLLPLTGEDAPDPQSLSYVKGDENGFYFLKDKNAVYFSAATGSLKRCAGIDAGSFEYLTIQVYKDARNVYFINDQLEQQKKEGSKENSYEILQGADAPSFTRIDDRNFEDKNTTWTISEKGEKQQHIPTRGRRVTY